MKIEDLATLFDVVMSSVPIGVAMLDDDLRFIYINRWLAALNGASAEGHLGRRPREIFPHLAPRIEPLYQRVLDSGEPIIEEEVNGQIEPSGEVRTWICSYSPVHGPDGAVKGVLSIVRDVTDRKKAEAAREQLAQELAEKNRELENIVYITSHDLRSPLVNIQGFARELERACGDIRELIVSAAPDYAAKVTALIESDVAESLHFIQAGATKINMLLGGLLKLSRIGRKPLAMSKIDMNLLIASVLDSMEYQTKQAGVEIAVDDLPACLGDEEQLFQVFLNLIDNAIKHCRNAQCRIHIYGSEQVGGLIYCVEDNGVGIAPDQLQKIFNLFYRLRPRETEGEGLGLTIAQKIVARHSGTIYVESELAQGSKFFVALPKYGGNAPVVE